MRAPSAAKPGPLVALAAALVALVMVTTAACSGTSDAPALGTVPTTRPDPPVVVASTPLVGALVRSVVGDQAEVRVLLDQGDDPATASVPDPAAAIAGADLLVTVDPGYERGLADVVAAADAASVDVLALAPQLNPVPLGGSELQPGTTLAAAATDPHVWLDPDRWTQAARLVAAAVGAHPAVDPAVIQANVTAFDDATARADETVQAAFATLAEDGRVVVADLPTLAYLADRYGFRLVLADGPEALAAAATANGSTVVVTAADRRAGVAAALATSAPDTAVVGLELDRPATADGTAASTGLLVTAATAIVELLGS